jgi:hypothetical protein
MGVLVVVEAVLVVLVLGEEVLVETGTVPIVGACVEAQALSEPSAATDIAPSRHRRAHGEAERRPKQITCC